MPGLRSDTTTVRITRETSDTLHDLSDETGKPMQEVLAEAVEAYRRRLLLEATNDAYAALRGDPARWQEELDEREAWEATLADRLGDA